MLRFDFDSRDQILFQGRNLVTKLGEFPAACAASVSEGIIMQEEFTSATFLAVTCIGVGLLGLGLISLAMN